MEESLEQKIENLEKEQIDRVEIQAGITGTVQEIRSVPVTTAQQHGLTEIQKEKLRDLFDSTVNDIIHQSRTLIVRDADTNDTAVKYGALASRMIKEIQTKVKDVIAPANGFVKDVRNFGTAYEVKLEEAKRTLGKMTSNYRGILELERRAQEEAQRKATEAVQGEIEQQAAALGVPPPILDVPTIKPKPMITRTEHGSAYSVKVKKHKIVNQLALPREYLMPNEKAIKDAVNSGIEVPGVVAWEETETRFRQ